MRFQDLDLRELLDTDPQRGRIQFAGERALILDAAALGLLRKELIETLGLAAARCILTRFGFAHGWRTAESMEHGFPWDSPRCWQLAGGRLHTLKGHVQVEPVEPRPGDLEAPYAEALWRDSYEAEQHLLHLGRAQEPVCWSLTGYASGYMSRVAGEDILCFERECVGKGDAFCRVIGNPPHAWGDAHRDQLALHRSSSLGAELEALSASLERVEARLQRTRRRLADAAPAGDRVRSPAMQVVLDLADRVARVDTTVLITGESGSGKERLARRVHEASPRAAGPFVAVNCGAIPETLLESELFGHRRGAFTGADRDRPGLFREAQRGTLLLDEVGDLPEAVQVKLLRVLQEREVRPLGADAAVPVDVRVLAATHRSLEAMVRAGGFREDLFYRLRVVELRVPPLRERREDLLEMARGLLRAAADRLGRRVDGFTPEAAERLLAHTWPGNVRELANAMEHALVLGDGPRLDVDALPPELRAAPPGPPGRPGQSLADLERAAILAALERHQGNREAAAAELGIGVATLYRRLKRYRSK